MSYHLQHDQVWHLWKVLVIYYCQQIAAQIAVGFELVNVVAFINESEGKEKYK